MEMPLRGFKWQKEVFQKIYCKDWRHLEFSEILIRI